MKRNYFFLIFFLIYFNNISTAQTGPWAKYDAKMKGEALIRESDGGYLKEVQSIVEGGGDVNWTMERSGLTPLMAASSGGHIEVVKFLLSKGAIENRKDANGRTALDRAKLVGAMTILNFLAGVTKDTQNIKPPEKEQAKKIIQVLPDLNPAKNTSKIVVDVTQLNTWAPFGTYIVGKKVKFFIGSWKEGTVIEVGSPGNYAAKNISSGERKYQIAREGAPNWNEWIDWGSVTGLERENYWTGFFIGDWRLGETMAVNTRTDGAYQRDEYSFHSATEALRVNENKTYRWKTMDKQIINGKWKAAEDGAGIIILKGFRDVDWVLRNETNAAEENIRQLQSARLTTNGKMSITAKRPL